MLLTHVFSLRFTICLLAIILFAAPELASANADLLSRPETIIKAIEVSRERPLSALIPRDVFTRTPKLQKVRLSPNGRYLSYLIDHKKYETLWIMDIQADLRWPLYSARSVEDTHWSTNSLRLFVEAESGLSSITIAKGSSPSLMIVLDAKEEFFFGVDQTHPQAILISSKEKRDEQYTLYRITPDSQKKPLYQSNAPLADFLLDENGSVRFIKKIKNDIFEVSRVDEETGKLTLIFECGISDPCTLLSYQESTDQLYVRANFQHDLASLYKINLSNGHRLLLHQDPAQRFDLNRLLIEQSTQLPKMARYVNDMVSYYGLDDTSSNLLKKINKVIPGNTHHIMPSNDFTRFLITDLSLKKRLPDYYVYDSETSSLIKPFNDLPDKIEDDKSTVLPSTIAQTLAIYYQVSDEMQQQGYLTLPNGIDSSIAPLVVVPHGGPWSRAEGGYHSYPQFLANRGYVVFEPNFRSSTGLGRNYVLSANKDFGNGRVHQDILDGMEYVLALGIGDRSKLGIAGHSFGGFSVLGALAFTPDLFQVGFAGAPPVDLALAIQHPNRQGRNQQGISHQVRFKLLAVDINDPKDIERLSRQSPNAFWQDVRKPLYLLAGGKDNRVAIQNVKHYVSRHSQARKPISLLVDENEGHSFREKLAREAYFYILEKALALNLGGRLEEEKSAKLERYLKENTVINTHEVNP